ncbi:MAG: glycoside hydrolase family 78 protein [Lachnospiraceae bacterium]|nr:glycoside hydrolase family 78 protein [Lachnospiraceae bacterium]
MLDKFITNGNYNFTEKGISPIPMLFRRDIEIAKKVKKAVLFATAIGVYNLYLNEERVGREYFAPGFTSYKSTLLYQTYDLTNQLLQGKNSICASVSGGWAVGSFVFTRQNRVTANRQAFAAELHITYEDGSKELISTDEKWWVCQNGPLKEADIYDGEVFDASLKPKDFVWQVASKEKVKIHPELVSDDREPVVEVETLSPVSRTKVGEEYVYDFGQNFAGVVKFFVEGKEGQKLTFRHAEVLNSDGSLQTDFLRSAKARVFYICKDGDQEYSPEHTYMGFRYVGVSGLLEEQLDSFVLEAKVLSSASERNGDFSCDNEDLNRLQQNIVWGGKSNLFEIPTDCPQRDERMGWTGDIAVFAPTACFNFKMERFLKKWLRDMRSEQIITGGIPNTIPSQGYGFPATMPTMAVDFWGDACIMVPYAMYMAYGDKSVLEENYEMMKSYVKACSRWAAFLSVGSNRYIWNTFHMLHFGDWVSPDVPQMEQWQKRSPWTATASLYHSAALLSKIAEILGFEKDETKYKELSEKVADAYVKKFTDGNGKLLEEFQTAYVLPIHFKMFDEDTRQKAAANLAELVKKNDYCIGTGFPGTPYILFALADNGYADVAYKMLFNTKCPSWLYEVKMGATTIWERWDGLDETGNCPIGDDGTDLMISYNHYASGAVGDFLYKRVLGIEPIKAGYKVFQVKPVLGEELHEAKGYVDTPYGKITVEWERSHNEFIIHVGVPEECKCKLVLPNGVEEVLSGGEHERKSL